jgi:hypothetical protein
MTETDPKSTDDVFTNLVIACLAPMFLAAAGGDIALAGTAAIQAINAYRAQSRADILTVAQIIGFGLAALDSLSRSMQDDLPPALTLRLRANAGACSRAAKNSRHALTPPRPPQRDAPAPARRQAAPSPAPTATEDNERRSVWASAMEDVAAEVAADLSRLSPDHHRAATMQIAALQSTANNLRAGRDGAFPAHR